MTRPWPYFMLLVLSWLYGAVVAVRRFAYDQGILPSEQLAVPVIVVGNLLAGGSGKTPVVLYLAQALRSAGRKPGIISRGYGGSFSKSAGAHEVHPNSDPQQVGDEPLLLARRSNCPVFVGAKRVEAGRALLQQYPNCDVILSDDGLQHYALRRQFELLVVDSRLASEKRMLPAGLLRESKQRLGEVDAIVCHPDANLDSACATAAKSVPRYNLELRGDSFYRLPSQAECAAGNSAPAPVSASAPARSQPSDFTEAPLHAVAGIAVPQRFFAHLRSLGLNFVEHVFPDHHPYSAADLAFGQGLILTTEKDAVKLSRLTELPIWVLPVTAGITPNLTAQILEKINGCPPA